MEHVVTLAGIALPLLFVAMSPGPAFIVVTRQAIARSRGAGIVSALGVSIGSVIWVSLIMLGIAVVLEQAAWLYGALRLAGGLYLVHLGFELWRGAHKPMTSAPVSKGAGQSLRRLFWRAVLLQMLNPKAAVFFSSIFLTMLSPSEPAWVKGAALAVVFTIEFGWFFMVAVAFSLGPAHRAYLNGKVWIERLAGAWLTLFGVKLALSDR